MKTIMEFNMPEDREELEIAQNGQKYFSTLNDVYQYLRGQLKYNDKLTDDEVKVYTKVYDMFFTILNDNDVELFD